MRPITRQSTRLGSRRRVCQSPARRSFQSSVHRASEPRPPPNSHSEDSSSFHHTREEEAGRDGIAESQRSSAVKDHGETKTASEQRGSSFRRPTRLNRVSEVPKPPPIPGWFMKRNVYLAEDASASRIDESDTQTMQCVARDSGEVLFEIPYHQPKKDEATEQTEQKGDAAKERDAGEPEQQDQSSKDPPEDKIVQKSASSGTKSLDQNLAALIQLRESQERLMRGLRESRNSESDPSAMFRRTSLPAYRPPGIPGAHSKPQVPPSADIKYIGNDPLRWVFLEAQASIRAALTLPVLASGSSSFAANRVDVSLQCTDSYSHERLDQYVSALARHVDADVVRLDANDIADLTADYVGQGHDDPGSFANLGYEVFDGYQAQDLSSRDGHTRRANEKDEDVEEEEDEHSEDDEMEYRDDQAGRSRSTSTAFFDGTLKDLKRALERSSPLMKQLRGSIVDIGVVTPQRALPPKDSSRGTMNTSREDMHRDDARLTALIEQLLEAPKQKSPQTTPGGRLKLYARESSKFVPSSTERLFRWSIDGKMHTRRWLPDAAQLLADYASELVQSPDHPLDLRSTSPSSRKMARSSMDEARKTIVHVRDLRDICDSRVGNSIVNILLKVVQKRRRAGERIIIVGTTAQDVPGPFPVAGEAPEDHPFRSITIPPLFNYSLLKDSDIALGFGAPPFDSLDGSSESLGVHTSKTYWRILEINLRHLQSMLRTLHPGLEIDLVTSEAIAHLNKPGMHNFGERVFSFEQVQRIALTAIGLSQDQARANKIDLLHVCMANFVTGRADFVSERWPAFKEFKETQAKRTAEYKTRIPGQKKRESQLDKVKKSCNSHETRLLSGVVDPQNIKTAFSDVHATPETIDTLKMLTTLSLLRPDAFKYGVLANDRLSGLLLYGPPGTGKTLLAKAVAKESKATVMEISGAQIYEKYVGEGEKMVRAVFSLAKKLSPCVVFMDEADAMFGSRSNAGNRTTHREIINQFLREWDGMDDHGVFVMVATNRPFDLDDAVLRRLPRRLLVDLPVAKDRESILGIHLRNEELDSSVSLSKLAEQTPLYSGSDLKNLAVAAALAAVREENKQKEENSDYQLPDKRILTETHFANALTEISASISEDMSTLNAIRKFDEQYGDRKGRRKKTGMGFGANEGPVDESAARVRHAMLPGEKIDRSFEPGESPAPP